MQLSIHIVVCCVAEAGVPHQSVQDFHAFAAASYLYKMRRYTTYQIWTLCNLKTQAFKVSVFSVFIIRYNNTVRSASNTMDKRACN